MNEQAKPCPFCGSKPKIHNTGAKGERNLYACPYGHTGYLRMKEWNTRVEEQGILVAH